MQEKHLIKIVTLLWRVGTKIMKQSVISLTKQALNKLATRKGDISVFGYITQN